MAFKKQKTHPLLSGNHKNFAIPSTFKLSGLTEGATLKAGLETLKASIASGPPSTPCQPPPRDPFVDMLKPLTLKTRTENNAATFSATGHPLVDFFYQVVEDTHCQVVTRLLKEAWKEAPREALQLVAQLRDIRNGKGEKEKGLDAYIWLATHHPRTLQANLSEIVKVGYWKDLLEILERLCVGEEEWAARLTRKANEKGSNKTQRKAAKRERRAEWRAQLLEMTDADARLAAQSARAAAAEERVKTEAQQAKEAKRAKQLQSLKRAKDKFEKDITYRALHASVALLFAAQLKHDLEDLKAGKSVSSLAAKWAPSPQQHHDSSTCIASTIAELLYPEASYRPEGMSYEDYVELARRRYQKDYLTPLRNAAKITERLMSEKRWKEIPYERVPSICFKTNKKTFEHWDKERLTEFLASVKRGEKKINAGALKPHELVKEALLYARCAWMRGTSNSTELGIGVMEAQWKAYVDKLRESGELSSAMAICDVSGSMRGQPMEVAIALSLLTAEVTKPPFNQLICTFSAAPQLHSVKGDSLVEKVQDIMSMKWDMNTNLQAVFELLLERAVQAKLAPKDMIKSLFIFSDMEFDEAVSKRWNYSQNSGFEHVPPLPEDPTNFEAIKAKFEERGYKLPQIVFWNLSASRIEGQKSTPVAFNESGTALVSGFSGQLLKLFMDKAGNVDAWNDGLTPEALVMSAIKDKGHYDAWQVED